LVTTEAPPLLATAGSVRLFEGLSEGRRGQHGHEEPALARLAAVKHYSHLLVNRQGMREAMLRIMGPVKGTTMDAYDLGYERGFQDALDGKPTPAPKKNPDHYDLGYDRGWERGHEEKLRTFPSTPDAGQATLGG
jgi:hypothetical protein